MEQVNMLKRRSTDLWQSAQQGMPSLPSMPAMPALPALPAMPSMPAMPSFSFRRQPSQDDGMRGTWERLDLPPLPRSSHTMDIISGCAYIFGGEVNPREPVENDMLVIRLPFSSAGADYFKIPAKADKSVKPIEQKEGKESKGKVRSPPRNKGKSKESLDTVPLESNESLAKKSEGTETKSESKTDTGSEESSEASSETSSEASSEGGSSEGSSESGSSEANSVSSTESRRLRRAKRKGKELAARVEKPTLGDVPLPRIGHASATIGSRIFIYGGRGGPELLPFDEGGRVWVFDTRTRAWSHLDPVPAIKGGSMVLYPPPRSYHCATATDKPRDFAPPPPTKDQTWSEWALGDTSQTGIPQDPIVGNVAEGASDEEADGYGTFFVHGGCLASGDRTSDIWSFDVRSRTWTQLPPAPAPARGGASICISKSRLYRFGGYDGAKELGGQLDFIHLDVEMFDDNVTRGEVCVRANGGWQTIYADDLDASSEEFEQEPDQPWPEPRSVSSLHAVTIGGGTEYLVLTMGERAPSTDGHAGAGKFFNDVWVFQVPPVGMTAASLTSAMFQAMGRKTGEGKWTKIIMGAYDEDVHEMPRARGWLASAPMTDLEETGIVIFGGLDETNKRRGDGWILRLS